MNEPTADRAEANRQKARQWYQDNPERARETRRRYRQAHPEVNAAAASRWTEANRDQAQENNRQWRARVRVKVFDHYGRACACCGVARQLTIDHVNGDGREHRARIGVRTLYVWLVRNGFPDGFQTLCRPCNRSKGTGPVCRLDHSANAATGDDPASLGRVGVGEP